MSKSKLSGTTERSWINALKGIAICAVVMVHNVGKGFPDKIESIAIMGQYGVQIFFLISAYLTYISLDKVCDNGRKAEFKIVFRWWKKKFLHLIPMYYLALVIYRISVGGQPYWLGTEGKVTTLNFVFHLLFLHGFVPHYMDSILGVEWYLGNLAIMYILMPFIYRFVNDFEKALGVFWGSVFICKFISNYALNHCILDVWDSYLYSDYFGNYWFVQQLPVISLGIVLYFILQSKWMERFKNNKLLSYELLGFSLLMLLGEMFDKNAMVLMSVYVRYAFWFCILIVSQAIYANKFIDNKIFQMLGEKSYGIYLFHYLIIHIVSKYFGDHGDSLIKWGIKYIVVLGISILVSCGLERVFKILFRKI